jgi:molecular chaperone DnaK
MPAVRELARTNFGKEPYRYVQPDEVVANGAAIHAGMLLGLVDKAVLLDVLPLSLGVETQGGIMAKLIARNTPVPAAGSRIFTTAADYQTSIDLHVLQGERDLALECVSLGRFELRGIPAALRGIPKVEVTFEVDVDGLVQLSAQELLSGTEVKVRVASTKILDPAEIEGMAEEAVRSAAQDREARRQAEARIQGENVLAAMEGALGARGLPAPDPQARQIRQTALELRQALEIGRPDRIEALCQALRQELATLAKAPPEPGRSERPAHHGQRA